MGEVDITVGMTVVFHGNDSDNYIESGMTATVIQEPDSEGWFVIQGTDVDGDTSEWDVDVSDMQVDGTDGNVYVSVVTTSSVGNTTQALAFPPLSYGQRVRVHTLTVADNDGVSINGVEGSVYDRSDGTGVAPSGAYWWISFPVSNFQVDGFYTDAYGRAREWPDTYALDKNAPSPFTTETQTGKLGAFGKLVNKQRITPDDFMALLNEVNQPAPSAPSAPKIASVRTEYGHISPDGEVYAWDVAYGPYPARPIKINEELCEPCQRDVVTTEWVKS